MAYVIVALDDYARAARAVAADSSWHNLAMLAAWAVAQWGPLRLRYIDNGSVFWTTRYHGSCFSV